MLSSGTIVKQIDAVLAKHRQLRSQSRHEDCSDLPEMDVTTVSTLLSDTINRFAPLGSQYRDSIKALTSSYGVHNSFIIPHAAGILAALREAYNNNYLDTITDLIHADVFADFVEMAEHLLQEGYKDPAAVLTGSTLEEHLRKLAIKNGIATDVQGKPKKADTINSELAAQAVYSKLDQKSITAWLDLRNKAAHGKYTEYSKEQVSLMLNGVRDFTARVAA